MAGLQFVVEGTSDDVLQAITDTARASGFTVSTDPQGRLVAQKGSFGLSILLGALIAYCEFTFETASEGNTTRLTLTRNNPWWTGLIGIARVKKAAVRLADEIQGVLGSRVRSRTEV